MASFSTLLSVDTEGYGSAIFFTSYLNLSVEVATFCGSITVNAESALSQISTPGDTQQRRHGRTARPACGDLPTRGAHIQANLEENGCFSKVI